MSESRWATEFENHPFQASWIALKELLLTTEVDDQTVSTSVLELSRLKRVVAFVDEILSTLDPELIPRAVWPSFQQQTEALLQQVRNYVANRNIGHIANANENADNLLTYVRPYMVAPADAMRALQRSARTLSAQLETYTADVRTKSTAMLAAVAEAQQGVSMTLAEAMQGKAKLDEYASRLFVGNEQAPAIQKEIAGLLEATTSKSAAIDELYAALLVGTPKAQSTQAQVKAAEVDITATRDKTSALLDSAQTEVRQLTSFYEKIFGRRDEATSKLVGGLEAELDTRTTELKRLEDEQKIKHAAMFAKIESLLPGATSAGLATAYKNLKDNFATPIKRYTWLFYGSLGLLVIAALVMAVKGFSIYPSFTMEFVEAPNWDVILRALIYKAPFIAPVLWLAVFASTRRSQYERLQQEYAHKEALAQSYESYKKQIQDLKGDSDALQRELIEKAIDAIAFNASTTLDGKHENKLPIHQFLEKWSLDDFKKVIDLAKNAKPGG